MRKRVVVRGLVTSGWVAAFVAAAAGQATIPPGGPPAQAPVPLSPVAALALEAARMPGPRHVPLRDADGRQLGELLDPIAVAAARFREVIEAGGDAEAMARAGDSPMVVVVARPVPCETGVAPATEIRLARSDEPVPPMGVTRVGPDRTELVPGDWPDGTALRPFQPVPHVPMTVEIDYDVSACEGAAGTTRLPIEITASRPTEPLPAWHPLPAGLEGVLSPEDVTVGIWLDWNGQVRFPHLIEGAAPLADAAAAVVGALTFEPHRANGVPVAIQGSLRFGFTTTGEPPARPAVATSFSRSPTVRTDDVPGLTADTSRCGVSDDPTYGVDASNPVRLGGGPADGVNRERAYMMALRGPAGEGLRFKRLGAVSLGVNASGGFLDVWETTHAGRDAAAYIYLDMYNRDDPKAPMGFTCAGGGQDSR